MTTDTIVVGARARTAGVVLSTAALDPDDHDDDVETSAVETAAARLRTEVQITVDVRVLAGDPAKELARVAADTHAVMIVRSSNGPAAGLKAALHGSTASVLMHHQLVPILVVPVSGARP